MFINKRLIYLLALCGLLLFSLTSPLSANFTRMESMGLEGDSYWALQKDEAYINYNPAHLSEFTAQIFTAPVVEIGGLILTPVNNLNLYFNTGRPLEFYDYPGYDFVDLSGTPVVTGLTKEQYNATGSFKLGNMAFGMAAGYGGVEETDGIADDSLTASAINVRAGFYMAIGKGMDFDVAAGYTMWDGKQETAGVVDYEASTGDINVFGRFNVSLTEISKLHVFGTFQMLDRSFTEASVGIDNIYNVIAVGLSDEMNITKSSTVYAAAGFGLEAQEVKTPLGSNTYTTQMLKVSAGVETSVTEKITGRFGFNRLWRFYETDKEFETTENSEQNPQFTFGIGLKIGNVNLDWQLAQSLVQGGPYFISGVGGTSTFFEVCYHFETGSNLEM